MAILSSERSLRWYYISLAVIVYIVASTDIHIRSRSRSEELNFGHYLNPARLRLTVLTYGVTSNLCNHSLHLPLIL